MSRFARILGGLLLAAFAAGSVVHAASAASMTEMATGTKAMHMAGCADAGDHGATNDPACEIACISSSPASLSENRVFVARPSTRLRPAGSYGSAAPNGPPELHPPQRLA